MYKAYLILTYFSIKYYVINYKTTYLVSPDLVLKHEFTEKD